jgi:hypothetical protein
VRDEGEHWLSVIEFGMVASRTRRDLPSVMGISLGAFLTFSCGSFLVTGPDHDCVRLVLCLKESVVVIIRPHRYSHQIDALLANTILGIGIVPARRKSHHAACVLSLNHFCLADWSHAEIGTPQSVVEAQAGHLSKRVSDGYKHISEKSARKAADELARVRTEQRGEVRAQTPKPPGSGIRAQRRPVTSNPRQQRGLGTSELDEAEATQSRFRTISRTCSR